MRAPIETFQHSCRPPIGEHRGGWRCEVCGRFWQVGQCSASGEFGPDTDFAEIYSVTMLRADGTHQTFKVRE